MACYNVVIIKEGYSRISKETDSNRVLMHANSTCTLVQGEQQSSKFNLIVDTLTAWDRNLLIEGLQERNLSCDDITFVVCTHGHSDHVGNLNLFTSAETHIVGFTVQKPGDLFIDHQFSDSIPYIISEHLQVIPTPGHTMSDVSVVVENTAKGTIVIAGDLFEKKEDIENPGIWKEAGSESPKLQLANRQKVLDMANYIIPGHGPGFEVTNQMREQHRFQLLQ